MVSAENRDVSRRKALRKRRIARDIYRCWASLIENGGWEYYDNLHQYSKNKIHCSCPLCSQKTKNKGKRARKNYNPTHNFKASDVRKFEKMIQNEQRDFRKLEENMMENPFIPKTRPMIVNLVKENDEYEVLHDVISEYTKTTLRYYRKYFNDCAWCIFSNVHDE